METVHIFEVISDNYWLVGIYTCRYYG